MKVTCYEGAVVERLVGLMADRADELVVRWELERGAVDLRERGPFFAKTTNKTKRLIPSCFSPAIHAASLSHSGAYYSVYLLNNPFTTKVCCCIHDECLEVNETNRKMDWYLERSKEIAHLLPVLLRPKLFPSIQLSAAPVTLSSDCSLLSLFYLLP